jgi:hypothetical protein
MCNKPTLTSDQYNITNFTFVQGKRHGSGDQHSANCIFAYEVLETCRIIDEFNIL